MTMHRATDSTRAPPGVLASRFKSVLATEIITAAANGQRGIEFNVGYRCGIDVGYMRRRTSLKTSLKNELSSRRRWLAEIRRSFGKIFLFSPSLSLSLSLSLPPCLSLAPALFFSFSFAFVSLAASVYLVFLA